MGKLSTPDNALHIFSRGASGFFGLILWLGGKTAENDDYTCTREERTRSDLCQK